MSAYIYERGQGAKKRVMHLQRHDRLGRPLMASLCDSPLPFNTTINVPLGRPTCKRCLAIWQRLDAGSEL